MKARTRFAPSPTGFMHIGNLRTAIFEYLVAKHDGGDFILRVEDTDQNRKVEGAIDFIYNTLKLCDIKIDEGPNNEGEFGPYIQSERLELYKHYAEELVKMGKAYYCFCSEETLETMREEANARKVPFLYDGWRSPFCRHRWRSADSSAPPKSYPAEYWHWLCLDGSRRRYDRPASPKR